MSELSQQIASDFGAIFAAGEITDAITYTAKGAAGVTIQAQVGPASEDGSESGDGRYRLRRRSVAILTAAATGIETPSTEDSLTIDGQVWNITSIDNNGMGLAILTCVCDVRTSVQRANTQKL